MMRVKLLQYNINVIELTNKHFEGLQNVIVGFEERLNTLSDENIFVISHKQDMLVDKFKSTIKFEKVRNFSHVTE